MTTRKRSQATIERRNRDLARLAAGICHESRAENVIVLDMRGICDFTDYFVIASGTSAAQLRGIASEIEKHLREKQSRLLSQDGQDAGKWILLDYGDVVVHLFDADTRDFYRLEDLWGDAKKVRL